MSTRSLAEMFKRLLLAEGQTRAARSIEYFGWIDLVLGITILVAPYWSASLLHLPPLTIQGANYVRLVGLLVSGLGMLYVVSGRLNAEGFVFASLLDRPMVPAIMALLWWLDILPGPLVLAFSVSDFGGFLWTLSAWRADARLGPDTRPRPIARMAASFFGFVSGVVRNARTFHPDGRVFRGSVRSVHPADPVLAQASEQLAGSALLRMGMGLTKKGVPRWLADRIPDAPSIAFRFFSSSTASEIRLQRRRGEDLDLLCTAGGDRLWKLVVNLLTGGWMYGLRRFDYFQNAYYSQVPYRINDGTLDVWIRMLPERGTSQVTPVDAAGRDQGLTDAVALHAVVRIEAQRVGDAREPFVPFAEIRFEEEIQIDQEALHFDPVAGRGFVPHGFLTEVRKLVYASSAQSRAHTATERARREDESIGSRLARYFSHRPTFDPEGGNSTMNAPTGDVETIATRRRWLRIAKL